MIIPPIKQAVSQIHGNRFVGDNLQGDLSAFHLGYINHIR